MDSSEIKLPGGETLGTISEAWDGTLENLPTAKYGYVVDYILLGPTPAWGNLFAIYNFDCVAIYGTEPSICPKANRKPHPEWLPQIEKRFRDLALVQAGQTIHWVGSQSKVENVCSCFLNPASSPFKPSDEVKKKSSNRGPKIKPLTLQRANFVRIKLSEGLEWPNIYNAYRESYPDDVRATNDVIRLSYNRDEERRNST